MNIVRVVINVNLVLVIAVGVFVNPGCDFTVHELVDLVELGLARDMWVSGGIVGFGFPLRVIRSLPFEPAWKYSQRSPSTTT